METSTEAFLGQRITCARCHNHPLEKWTQVQYFQMANLFARVGVKNGTMAGENIVFAKWLTSPDNAMFSRTIVNRVWANFMGRGLVDPMDDLRATNPASNEELLAALSKDFVEH